MSAAMALPLPEGRSFVDGSALILTYATTIHALLDRGGLKAGETLLVLGAAGGVGLAAVELGKAFGARVIAAASSEEKAEAARAAGADAAIVYPRGPFDKEGAKALSQLFKEAVGPDGADLVYDPVGGDYTEAAIRCLRPDGRSLIVGFPAGIPHLPLNLVLLKACHVVGVFWGPWVWRDPQASARNMAELAEFYARGLIRPLISKRFALTDGARAIEWIGGRQALGKGIVEII